jgi:hypothetical protein
MHFKFDIWHKKSDKRHRSIKPVNFNRSQDNKHPSPFIKGTGKICLNKKGQEKNYLDQFLIFADNYIRK